MTGIAVDRYWPACPTEGHSFVRAIPGWTYCDPGGWHRDAAVIDRSIPDKIPYSKTIATSRRSAPLPRSSGQEVNVRLASKGPSQPTSRPAGRSPQLTSK